MYSTLPPQSSQGYDLLLGPGPGQQTQIFDMAASERADSAFDVANREYDEALRDLYDAQNLSIDYEEEGFFLQGKKMLEEWLELHYNLLVDKTQCIG